MRSTPVPVEQSQAWGWQWVLVRGARLPTCTDTHPSRCSFPSCNPQFLLLLQEGDTSRDALTLLWPSAPACSARACWWPWPLLPALPCSCLRSPWPDCPGLPGWPRVKESTLLCLTRRFAHPAREQPAQPWIVFRFLLPSGRSTGKVFM